MHVVRKKGPDVLNEIGLGAIGMLVPAVILISLGELGETILAFLLIMHVGTYAVMIILRNAIFWSIIERNKAALLGGYAALGLLYVALYIRQWLA